MNIRLLFASFVTIAMLAGCRGGAGSNAIPPAAQPGGAFGSLPAKSVTFAPIGPTHMSDGYPTSGKVNAFAVDPANSKVIYAASGRGTGLETYSSAGILGTTDGGTTWKTLTNGLVDSSGNIASAVNTLWLDPAKPKVLLAGTEYDGIFRTADGGASWTNVYSGGHATQFVSFGNALYATDDAGILTSTDDGKTWTVQLAGSAKQHPTAFGAVSTASGHAFYAGMSNGYIYAFASGKWTKLSRLPFTKQTGTDGSSRLVH
ncbi:MAG TPA: hypothetical protein VHR97_01305, partial [Candidatus Baltobacteraceae bacterium]|nr:hypothetical protein [Candidatus Baltobacteraceae bacterium]